MRGLLEYIGWKADNAEADAVLQDAMGEGRVLRLPEPVPATRQLRTNLERVTLAYNDRERVLVKEIAEREAELADVRRARDATTAAMVELEVGEIAEVTVEDDAPKPLTGEEWDAIKAAILAENGGGRMLYGTEDGKPATAVGSPADGQ